MTAVHGGWLAPPSLQASIGTIHLRRSSVMQTDLVATAHRLCLPYHPCETSASMPGASRWVAQIIED